MTGVGDRPRLGLIVPSTNLTIERLLQRSGFTELFGVDVVVTRLAVTTIAATPDSDRQFEPGRLLAASRLLADARPDVIAWTGTSSFWLGLDEEVAWMRALGADLGIPLTSATEAVIEALAEEAGNQVSLFTPYEEPIHRAVAATLEAAGIEVRHQSNLGITDNASFAELGPSVIEEAVRGFPGDDPVVVVCTNVTACLLDAEVVDSLVAVLWYAMALATGHQGLPGGTASYRSFYRQLATRLAVV
jgi:maleate isomerase